MAENYNHKKYDNLREQAEKEVKGKFRDIPESLEALSLEESQRLLHQLWVYQVELEMQNEELRRAQLEIEASRALYFDLYNLAPFGYLIMDEWNIIRDANLTFARMLGRARGELAGKPLTNFIGGDDQDVYYLARKQLWKTRNQEAFELRLVKKDNSCFWVRLEMNVVNDHGRGVPVCRAVIMDVTKLKQAEEIQKTAHTDLERRVRERTSELEKANKVLSTERKELRRIEWMLSTKSKRGYGTKIQINKQPAGDSSKTTTSGFIQNSVGKNVLQDIADYYVDLLETSVSIYEKDGGLAYEAIVSKWCQSLHCTSHILCKNANDFDRCPEFYCMHAAQVAVSTEAPVDSVCCGRLHVYAIPIWKGTEVVGAISISYGDPPQEPEILKQLVDKFAVDIKQLQENARHYESRPAFIIQIAKEKLHGSARLIGAMIEHIAKVEVANRELESFAYSVSHDLRAPLRAINGFSRIIMEDYADKLDTEGNRLLNIVRANSQKLDVLITDLLSLTRVARAEVRREKIDMSALVHSVYRELSISEENNLDFSVEDVPTAFGDPVLLRQVWFNVIENAIKYTRKQDKRLIRVGGYREKGFSIYFVKDNGVGFNPQYTHKLFGIFQRLHNSEEFEGTGIGLAIVQRIIHRHEGKVWAEGQENQGAIFYFSLPVKEGEDGQVE